MMKTRAREAETVVWLEEVPSHLFYEGERWRVIDMPTRVGVMPDAAYGVMHPPAPLPGWRFRAKSEHTGADRIFEVRNGFGAGWEVVQALG